mgnify:FL=1
MSDLPARLRVFAGPEHRSDLAIYEEAADKIDQLNDEICLLHEVFRAARSLTDECEGGKRAPSLGALARLESALSVAYHSRAYRGWSDIKEWSR